MEEITPAPKTRRPVPKWEIIEIDSYIIKINRNPRIEVAAYCRHDSEKDGVLYPSMFYCNPCMPTYADVMIYERGDEEYPIWSVHLTAIKQKGVKDYHWIEIDYLGNEAENVVWGMEEVVWFELSRIMQQEVNVNSLDCTAMTEQMICRAVLVAQQHADGTFVPSKDWGSSGGCRPGEYATARKKPRPEQTEIGA